MSHQSLSMIVVDPDSIIYIVGYEILLHVNALTFASIMLKNDLKILRFEHRKILKVCLAIFQHYTWKG